MAEISVGFVKGLLWRLFFIGLFYRKIIVEGIVLDNRLVVFDLILLLQADIRCAVDLLRLLLLDADELWSFHRSVLRHVFGDRLEPT